MVHTLPRHAATCVAPVSLLDKMAKCEGCGSVAFAHEGSGIVCLRCERPLPHRKNMKSKKTEPKIKMHVSKSLEPTARVAEALRQDNSRQAKKLREFGSLYGKTPKAPSDKELYEAALKSPEWADVQARAWGEPHCREVALTPRGGLKLTFVVPYKGAVALFDALIAARRK